MYVFYEHHRDSTGQISLTEIRLSSRKERFEINFNINKEKAIFDICKVVLKQAPVALRSYMPDLFIWQYIGPIWGETTLKTLKSTTAPLGGVNLIEVDDLAGYCRMGKYDPTARAKRPKAEDFFYEHTATKTVIPKEFIVPKLAKILEISEQDLTASELSNLKKLYRRAALRLHPDRNNSDGSMMSELNMLWSIYNAV